MIVRPVHNQVYQTEHLGLGPQSMCVLPNKISFTSDIFL